MEKIAKHAIHQGDLLLGKSDLHVSSNRLSAARVASGGKFRGIGQASTVRSSANTLAQAEDVLVVPRKGLQLPRQLPFERWISIGHRLSVLYTSSAWCLGDWLIYGEETYSGRYR